MHPERGMLIPGREEMTWIQVYQMKMRTYKRVPIPDVLYKIMKRYLEKYHIGSEDYVFQNKRGGAYQYGSFKWQMKELFNKRQDISKGMILNHMISATRMSSPRQKNL